MPPSTILSTFNATWFPDPHCGYSAPKRLLTGKALSQPHDARPVFCSQCVRPIVAVTKPRRALGDVRGRGARSGRPDHGEIARAGLIGKGSRPGGPHSAALPSLFRPNGVRPSPGAWRGRAQAPSSWQLPVRRRLRPKSRMTPFTTACRVRSKVPAPETSCGAFRGLRERTIPPPIPSLTTIYRTRSWSNFGPIFV